MTLVINKVYIGTNKVETMPGVRKRGEEIRDFDKTTVPMRLANSSDLVSRSQARRVLSGLELFKEVILDFKDIEYIGQAFADEIFRVFTNMNPATSITPQNANDDVQYMINRAINTKL